jgi:hypothetical protein
MAENYDCDLDWGLSYFLAVALCRCCGTNLKKGGYCLVTRASCYYSSVQSTVGVRSFVSECSGARRMKLRVAVAEAQGQFWNPEEGEHLLLEACKLLPSDG